MLIYTIIARNRYLYQIKTALKRSKITALLGPRQCGKTTLAKEIARSRDDVLLDMESPSDRAKLQNPEYYINSISGLVIIDEIQQMPELFPILRVLADKTTENGRFLILGSASPDLVRNTSESLAGRLEFVDLQGFDITEIDSAESRKLWLRGGFPRSFLAESEEDSTAWIDGFTRTFLQRDIPQLGIRVPAAALRRFWTMLAYSHGQILNSSKLAGSMGMNNKTIRSYIDLLIATYMIRSIPPWYENIKKRQVKSPKIYFTDTGLLHHLLGIHDFDTLLGHPQAGASWKGFVLEQILRNVQHPDPYFWSTYSGAELDLLLIHGSRRIGIECKFNESPKTTKSMHAALQDLKLEKLYIAYPGKESYSVHEAIDVCSVPKLIKLLSTGAF